MFVIGNFLLQQVFRYSLSVLIGALLSFQVIAHMPLMKLNMQGRCYYVFSILTYVMSFDIIPMDDFYESVGYFTETEAWSDRFLFLYYDSVNFVMLLGSILFFILAFGLTFLIILFLICKDRLLKPTITCSCMSKSTKDKLSIRLRPIFNMLSLKQSVISFLQGAFLELFICTCVSMKSFEIWSYLNQADILSLMFAVFGLFTLFLFVMFVFYAICFVTKRIETYHKGQRFTKYHDIIRQT